MATAKKTTTTKKTTSTSDAPKKPRTPKPVVENKEPTDITENTKIKKEETPKKPDKVLVSIPYDPSETMEEPFMHGSVNGKFYRLRRGREHLVTPSLAEEILRRNKTAKELEEFVDRKRIRE